MSSGGSFIKLICYFLNASPEQKHKVANEVLWNLSVHEGKTAQVRYRSYFEAMANAPKNGDFAKNAAILGHVQNN